MWLRLWLKDKGQRRLEHGQFQRCTFREVYDEQPEYVIWLLTHVKNEPGQFMSSFLDYCEKCILHLEQVEAVQERDSTEDLDPLEAGMRRLECIVGGLRYRVEELEKANIPRDGGSRVEIL